MAELARRETVVADLSIAGSPTVFETRVMSADDADIAATVMVDTDLNGVVQRPARDCRKLFAEGRLDPIVALRGGFDRSSNCPLSTSTRT